MRAPTTQSTPQEISTKAPDHLRLLSKRRRGQRRIVQSTNPTEDTTMARMLPDPTFYPSPRMAGEAPTETLAYVALLTSEQNGKKDALGVVDTDPASPDYGRLVGRLDLPNGGNELHHFG